MIYLPRSRTFWSVSLGHFTNDTYMAMGTVLLTFLSSSVLPMSNAQIGLAISVKQLAGAVTQPFFGIRADRTGGRWLGAGGLLFVIAMFCLALFLAVTTRSYLLMLIPFVLQGLGSGALHPVGSLHAAEADPDYRASNMSYFFLMGQTGLAFGPTLIGLLLDWANRGTLLPFSELIGFPAPYLVTPNVSPLYILAMFALPPVLLMAFSIPFRDSTTVSDEASSPEKKKKSAMNRRALIWPFVVIGLMVIFRGLAQPGSVNFIPRLFEQKGWSPAEYGLITSLFWIASGIAGVVFGNLADRFDRRYIVMLSMVLSAPAFFLLPLLDGYAALGIAVLAGGFSGGAHSIIVVLAQELIPQSKGFASGAILGFIFGTGALGSLAIGTVSDVIGLGTTFQLVAVAAVVSGLLGLLLPKNRVN